MRFFSYLVTCISLLALLSACGFHLRGSIALPAAMARTEVRGVPPHSPLAQDLDDVLAEGGVKTVGPGKGTAVLQITGERFEQRVSSVDSAGKATQYEFRYTLGGSLLDAAGKALAPAQTAVVIRTLDFDSANVLGFSSEADLLRREMVRDGARQLMRQFRTVIDYRGKTQ